MQKFWENDISISFSDVVGMRNGHLIRITLFLVFHGSLEECIRFVYSVDFLVQVVSETRYDSIRDFFAHDKLEKTLSLETKKCTE